MNILLFVTDNYPHSLSAGNIKGEFIAKGLLECGCNVTIVDSLVGQLYLIAMEKGVSSVGIPYYRLPRRGRYLFAPFYNLKNVRKILRYENRNDENYAIIHPDVLIYYNRLINICHNEGYKVLTLYHEFTTSFPYKHIYNHLELASRDNHLGEKVDGILPISHFLEEWCRKFQKPQMILPVLSNYDRRVNTATISNTFTFCGSAGYILRYTLFIEAFKEVNKKYPESTMTLVVFGDLDSINDVKNLLVKEGIDNAVNILSQIPQSQLYDIYDTSLALLIPLDPNNLQDKARFSQKIAEYVGSKRPIITTAVGEIPYYFVNNKSAIITSFSKDGYVEAMERVIRDPQLAMAVGAGGFEVGINYFDYKVNAEKLILFCDKL